MAAEKRRVSIAGVVLDATTDETVAGLIVEAWNTDDRFDAPVGTSVTDDRGDFLIDIARPPGEIFFKVFCDTDLVVDTRRSVIWGPKGEKKVRILVPDLYRFCPPRKDCCDYRDVYLKIESILGYSPVEPSPDAHDHYRRDCFRNPGHESGTISDGEVNVRRLDALVYREYKDETYTVPTPGKLVKADILEPDHLWRVPATVIYTKPGERLRVHVFNCDDEPHSFHVHGLAYGSDSDGAYPFGVVSADGRRSDEICPGECWTYEYEVREDMVGCWPFHSHYRRTEHFTNRGLFGGIVVRNRRRPRPDHEVPFFMHRMVGARSASAFDSGNVSPGGSWPYTFAGADGQTFDYFCRHHSMFGQVKIKAGAAMSETVNMVDPPAYDPAVVEIAPGGTVLWNNAGNREHTVTENAGAGAMPSFCINGRTYEGNTPRIAVDAGDRIRWYVFNLDFGMDWHNFHTHAQRWKWGDEYVDTRSLGPAESFCVDTIAPDAILLPCEPAKAKERRHECKLCADFPVHCHVDPHMMQGMTATLRVRQVIALTKKQIKSLGFELPIECSHGGCPEVDLNRCRRPGSGRWETLPDAEVYPVHAAVLRTGKVLLFSGRAEVYTMPADYPLESSLFDPASNTQTSQPVGENLFCAGHTFLPDGRLLVGGGDRPASDQPRIDSTHVFDPDPAVESWTKLAQDMNDSRWYPTLLPLSDGRIFAASGAGGANTTEIYGPDPANPATLKWTRVAGADRDFGGYYPSLHQLPNGEVFFSRTSWSTQSGTTGARLVMAVGAYAGTWSDMTPMQFPDRKEGASVIVVDASVSPAATHVYVCGGGEFGTNNPQSAERINVTATVPAQNWERLADMHFKRINCNALVLPTGQILVVGGRRQGPKFGTDPQPVLEAEIYDPLRDEWTEQPPMTHPRQYHSVAVLLADGRVLAAGGILPNGPMGNVVPHRDQRTMEMFYPPYLAGGSRPSIDVAPTNISYGSPISVQTPQAGSITSAALIRPHAVTHHTDGGHRYVKMSVTATGADSVAVDAPNDAFIAPPGYYMLFIIDSAGVPSEAAWVQLS